MAKVKVRVAVAVDSSGNWHAGGWMNHDDEDVFEMVVDDLKAGEARYFITAELDAPTVGEVPAEEVERVQ